VTVDGGNKRLPLRNGRLPWLLLSGRAVGVGNVVAESDHVDEDR